jgi:hypothetical protein
VQSLSGWKAKPSLALLRLRLENKALAQRSGIPALD